MLMTVADVLRFAAARVDESRELGELEGIQITAALREMARDAEDHNVHSVVDAGYAFRLFEDRS